MRFEPVVSARPPILPFAVLAAITPALLFLPITHDAIWQMWLGQHMLGGELLYADLLEVNPPLWFWMAMPLAAIGADPRLTIIVFFIAATALSLYLIPARFRLAALAVFVIVPMHDFGQREHFTLIAAAPYVFAIAGRRRGEEPRHPVLIGLFAAIGLCLKPYFLLLPVAMEPVVHKRLRPEIVAIATFVAAYAVSIPLFAPAYFTDALPIVLRFYGAFGQSADHLPLAVAFAAMLAGACLGRRKGSAESRLLIVAALAFVPAILIQAKGFSYHSIPTRGFLCLAVVVELLRSRQRPIADSLLVAAALICCSPFGVYRNSYRSEMEQHLAGIRPGTSIIVLASNPSLAWPMVAEHRLDWQLHEFSTWQVNAVVQRPDLLAQARQIVAPDLAKRPDVLIIDRRPYLGPVARALVPDGYLACYRMRLRTPRMQSYRRVC